MPTFTDPNIPIMMGIREQPRLDQDRKLVPLEKHGVKLMSVGFMGGSSKPVIWRGPLVGRMVRQFLYNVDWGNLDYLFIDLPPGTGDAQLTLTQSVALTGGNHRFNASGRGAAGRFAGPGHVSESRGCQCWGSSRT